MTIHLSIVIFLPLAAALIGVLLGGRAVRWAAVLGSLGVLGYAVAMLIDFDSSSGALQYVTDDAWIPQLGIRWSLGLDGLNLLLVALTALLWFAATVGAAFLGVTRIEERPKLFFFQLALAQSAVLGAFLAQDLAVFVFFFDLMLVPFYFLIGAWGRGERVAATTKLVIYTLVGSLLMLAGAIALGVLSTPSGGQISFSLAELAQRPLPEGTQLWIFVLFALAFLVKMPAFPLHGWMPDGYRAAPLAVLIVFSAVVSKVAAYGFLRIVLPTMPEAALHFQDLMLILAVLSIVYGSALAFSSDDTRLVLGYSSVAQLGFITLGIFSLTDLGAQGALMQMVNHGLVVAALFLIVGLLAARAGGSESLDDMGGIASRAPVLAALFLIASLASLAMPGSPNFVGELLILFGTLESQIVFGVLACSGVAMAAVYMIRMYQRAMHNGIGAGVESREICRGELALLAPLVAVIIALGIYPQFALGRSEATVLGKVAAVEQLRVPVSGGVILPGAQIPEGVPGTPGAPLGPQDPAREPTAP